MTDTRHRILIIDDERGVRSLCADVLGRAGYAVELAETGREGIDKVRAAAYELVLGDIRLPDMDGIEVVRRVRAFRPEQTIILITAYPSVESAVRGMKLGARDYLAKPFTPDELRMVVARAVAEDALRRDNAAFRDYLAYSNLVGESAAMQRLRDTIEKVAPADASVLISGESGVGKEVVARAIHYRGPRGGKPFVAVNCGALVGDLLESELFGHVRGAFTGADRAKRGLFMGASGGSLFLDEIGELPLLLQPKLLRALQDREIKPVGGVQTIRVDVRIIAATNRNLGEKIAQERFRQDLYYRLNVLAIEVPPLRERRDDMAALAAHFVARVAERSGTPRRDLTPAALQYLASLDWPGNVRELENAIERALVLATGPMLDVADFEPVPGARAAPLPFAPAHELLSLTALERVHIERVLAACNGQKTKAAAILGINRTTLWKKLRAYGLE